MTLIAFHINQEIAVVAADRRLTYPDRSIFENDRTKLLAWSSGLVFGFTGQAFLMRGREQIPTLEWLAHEIATQGAAGAVYLGTVAERLSRQNLPAASARLAIAGVGFLAGAPSAVLISNMHDDEGAVTAEAAKRFKATKWDVHGEFFKTLGGELSPSAKDMLRSSMPAIRNNPSAVAEVFAGVIEHSSGALVGDQALVVTFHRDTTRGVGFLCDLVTPNMGRPGVVVDFAIPIFVDGGTIMTMPPQRLRRGSKG